MTPSGIEPVTFQLVVQCLNQLRYCVPHLKFVMCVNYVNAYAVVVQLAVGWTVRVSNSSPKLSRRVVGLTQPPSKWVPGFFLEVKTDMA